MSKRKRNDDNDGGRIHTDDQARQLQATISRSVKTLSSALKLARGFERQKLGRRQKHASSEPKTLLRLREEVIVLKQLDLDKTARNYLIKHCSKTKKVREAPAFQHAYGPGTQADAVKPGAEANVIGRLMNSAPVKKVMPQITASTYRVLGLERERENSQKIAPAEPKRELVEDRELQQRSMSVESVSNSVSVDADLRNYESDSHSSAISLDAYQDRIADSDEKVSDSSSSYSAEGTASPSRDETKDKTEKTVTFLPALSMGGYFSGSESDVEELGEVKPRKNRRGQRARQQLAELKFGKNAKHLHGQDQKAARNAGWDAKRGAVSGNDYGKRRANGDYRASNIGFHSGGRDTSTTKSGQNGSRRKVDSRDDAGPLHPSWEAAKLRKSQPTSQASFSGKKITFD